MNSRQLGRNGPQVSTLGLGCMGMSFAYGAGDDAESIATIHAYLDAGGNFLDTADMYGPHTNERLVGGAIRERRDDVFLATKFGFVYDPNEPSKRTVCGRPDYVKSACDASLQRLGVDVIDLYYLHRVDSETPIEETVGAMAELVYSGKVRYLGLSEAGPATLRRAVTVDPIAALQSEYSLWTREPEDEILATCRELGIGFVAYSPLGRGMLTGKIQSVDDLEATDFRRGNDRFLGANFARNLDLVRAVEKIAQRKGCTTAQLALAWVLAQAREIVTIPGTKRRDRLAENLGALAVTITFDEQAELEAAFPAGATHGLRYSEAMMNLVRR